MCQVVDILYRKGINGCLVPPKNARALADTNHRLLKDSDLLAKMGEASRALAVEKFQAAYSSKRLVEIAELEEHRRISFLVHRTVVSAFHCIRLEFAQTSSSASPILLLGERLEPLRYD